MDNYNAVKEIIDYSVSTKNRKIIISSIEIGLGFLFLVLGIGTSICKVDNCLEQNIDLKKPEQQKPEDDNNE